MTDTPDTKKETQHISQEDGQKAKRKGGLSGDPVFTVGDE